MAKFPIRRTERTISGRGAAVRANIDVDTGHAALGEALKDVGSAITGVATQFAQKSKRQREMEERLAAERQQRLDTRSKIAAEAVIKRAEIEHDGFKKENADTSLWEKDFQDRMAIARQEIDGLDMSDDARLLVGAKFESRLMTGESTTLVDTTLRESEDTKEAADGALVNAIVGGDPDAIKEATGLWQDAYAGTMDKAEQKALFEELSRKALNMRGDAAVEAVHAAVKANNFGAARVLVDNPDIPESKQTTLRGTIDSKELLAFENNLNDSLIGIDNAPDMSQSDFDMQAIKLKDSITASNVPGANKKKLLADLERWRRGTGEVDYAKVLSLNQEMDAAQRSGIVDPTIETRIMRANLEGAFGGRNKGGQKTYADMIRRFKKLEFDERLQAIAPIVSAFARENSYDPELVFLFNQAKNKVVAENPDADTKDLFIKVSALAESYGILPPDVVSARLRQKPKTVLMKSPEGISYHVPIDKKQKFLDNGYTE